MYFGFSETYFIFILHSSLLVHVTSESLNLTDPTTLLIRRNDLLVNLPADIRTKPGLNLQSFPSCRESSPVLWP